MTPGIRREALLLVERQIRDLEDRHKVRPANEEPVEQQVTRYRDSAEMLILNELRNHLLEAPHG